MRALGTIIERYEGFDSEHCVQCGFLDYYDIWTEIDERLQNRPELRHAASTFGHDLVNLATYIYDILGWLEPDRIMNSICVVYVSAMTEAALAGC